ncbi:Rrf2 family transcriptional regulator [Nonomuraea sp. NPDC049309]|uniref:RrF2 family transcriptional regulator n=1 Tax=Nonomuraea sp. NPDC049309 TaxID=3364350 RepID=UPI0037106DB8
MRISARTQYALGAMLALATADRPVHAERIAASQEIPRRFCDNILLQLRRAGLLRSQRGPDGGYWLARPPGEIALADVIRVTEGEEQATRPFPRAAAPLAAIWERLRSHENALLSEITLADVVASGADHVGDDIPSTIDAMTHSASGAAAQTTSGAAAQTASGATAQTASGTAAHPSRPGTAARSASGAPARSRAGATARSATGPSADTTGAHPPAAPGTADRAG